MEVPQPLVDAKLEEEIKRRVEEEVKARLVGARDPRSGLLTPARRITETTLRKRRADMNTESTTRGISNKLEG